MQHKAIASLLVKTSLYTLLFTFFLLIVTCSVVGWWGYSKLSTFNKLTQTTPSELAKLLELATTTMPAHTDNAITFLILGLDTVPNRESGSVLTDTLLLASVNIKSGVVSQLSIPRDIWIPEYKTKINALYHYGLERNIDSPTDFPRDVIAELTGIDIQHTLVVSLEDFAEIIRLLGGITVTVPESFTDERFPTQNPENPYKVVAFEAGEQFFTAEQALEFIRSRNAEGPQGTDIARAERQQIVIKSLVSTLQKQENILNPEFLAKMYLFYQERFEKQLPLSEAIAIVNQMRLSGVKPTFITSQLPIYPENTAGVIEHPPVSKYSGQWVYEIRDRQIFSQTTQELLLR